VTKAFKIPEILDYNDPETPVGPFIQWQLSQYPKTYQRGSASMAMLTK
jgi:choline dehydrogenase